MNGRAGGATRFVTKSGSLRALAWLLRFLTATAAGGCEVISGLNGLDLVNGLDGGPADALSSSRADGAVRLDGSTDGYRPASRGDARSDAGSSPDAPRMTAYTKDAAMDSTADDARGHDAHTANGDASHADAPQASEDASRDGATHNGATHDGATHDDASRDDAGHRDAGRLDNDGGCGPTDTTTNCGVCGTACDEVTASSTSCNGDTCTYTCKPGHSNCNVTPPDQGGCECATPSCCGTSCETIHTNGVSGDFYDCANENTYNAGQALEACVAYTGNSSECGEPACGLGTTLCSSGSSVSCVCWTFSGSAAGHVYNSGTPGGLACTCPTTADPTWD